MAEDISVTFIIPKDCRSENECSEDMQLAFLTCEQHCGGGLKAQWVHESKWTKFEGLTKRDVFVLTEFEGALYEKLQATKCLLVGPRCLSCCLTEGTPIPSGPEPVFTIAMRGLTITASGLSKTQKEEVKKKVHWMGGIYSTVLTDDTTHLISDTVLSDKYIKSVEKGIPVMAVTWIQAVWEASLQQNISASSSEFLVHRLPPFTNLQFLLEDKPSTPAKSSARKPRLEPASPMKQIEPEREKTPEPVRQETTPPMALETTPMRILKFCFILPGIKIEVQGLDEEALLIEEEQQPLEVPEPERMEEPVTAGDKENAMLPPVAPTIPRRLSGPSREQTPKGKVEKNAQTPDSAFGAALRPGSGRMSPDARKRLWKFVDGLPSKQAEPAPRDKHTASLFPLSEIRNRFLAQFNGDAPTPPSEHTAVAPRKLQLQSPGGITTSSTITVSTPKPASSPALPAAVDAQLQRLSAALTGRLSSQRARRQRESTPTTSKPCHECIATKVNYVIIMFCLIAILTQMTVPDSEPAPESQPNTVGWDDTTPAQQPEPEPEQEPAPVKRFMLSSNVDNREEIIAMITQLGGEVCEGAELDPEASHLLCAAPGRSEKMLGSIAAGRWVLHPVYIARSHAAGTFLPGTRKPPYTNENITVCFADIKRYPLSDRDSAWLISKRIPVCAPVLLSSFLTDDPPPKPEEHCLPDFRP
ncbi:hypothetical protein HF086_001111 [Spodoptera exigua]|uniref:BRCT domain-containing protein n=1 Tax=Spodoptera exigua TaxID=7107 RepID=A0A922S8H5_SPOEX|nr:hypothetical protein HF086_001111 [Spodoptera exigua]